MFRSVTLCLSCVALMLAAFCPAQAGSLYSNGFGTDTSGWYSPNRVASGTNSVTSSSGSFHAEVANDYTDWGGYNFGAGNAVPTVFQPYTTSLDIYLNVDGGWNNDTRFDFTSAINNAGGTHLQDFVFNAGFYSDATGPGAGTNRFVISTGNNAGRGNSFPKNTGAIAISTTGWYQFQQSFYNDAGFLKVDFNIFDSASALVSSWTLGGTKAIAGVGGNRYGWFASNEFSTLAIDNSQLSTADFGTVPEPTSLAIFGALGLVACGLRCRKQ